MTEENNLNNDSKQLNNLMDSFKEVVANLIQTSSIGNFVDVESTYDNFIKHNKDLIAQLDSSDKQKFINELVNIFVNSIGLNLSSQDVSNLIQNSNSNDAPILESNDQCSTSNTSNQNLSGDNVQECFNNDDCNNCKTIRNEHLSLHRNRGNIFNTNNNDNQVNTKTLTWFGKMRYFLYKFTSISANSGRFSFPLFCAMVYNIIILAMTLSSLTPIIATIAHMGWTEHEIYLRNFYINKYRVFMFAFAWCLIIDWIIRFVYADFSNPYVSTKKAFLSYLFSISNIYQLGSVIGVITLLFIYGRSWGTDLGQDSNNVSKQVATILFLLNVAVVIPRFAENFFFGKNLLLLKKILKSKWKILFGAGTVLIILLLIFAFAIYESESAYYIQEGWLDPTTGKYDMNAFTHGEPFETIWEALWYSFITITTIGYGDYVPYSTAGKIIAVLLAVVGISYFTFIMGILVNIFSDYSTARKTEENRLKDSQEKNNQLKQFNYLHELIINDFAKLGLIDKDKLDLIKNQENQQMTKASDVLDEVEINNRGNLVWNKQQLGNRVYNNKEIKAAEDMEFKPIDYPNVDVSNDVIYSFDDIYLRRILRYKHFSVLLTKVLGTTNLDHIFICKEHFNREVYARLSVATSVVMPKQLAYDAYASFSQFENKLQFESCFKDDDCVQITLISDICPFPKINRLTQYGLNPKDFITYKFLSQINNNENNLNNIKQ